MVAMTAHKDRGYKSYTGSLAVLKHKLHART